MVSLTAIVLAVGLVPDSTACSPSADDSITARARLIDRTRTALSAASVTAITGTYSGSCNGRAVGGTDTWTVSLSGGPANDELSVRKDDTDCVLTLTSIITADGTYIGTPAIALDATDAYSTSASTFALAGGPLAFYGNAKISSLTFAEDFTISILFSDGPTTTSSANITSQRTTCPENYVTIAPNSALGTVAFCASKYEMKLSLNDGTPVFDGTNGNSPVNPLLYKPDSRPNGVPWVRVSHSTAFSECQSLGAGYHQITAKEHQAIAREIELQPDNWSGGAVGSGALYRGHSDDAISATAVADGYATSGSKLLGAGDDANAYAGTGQTAAGPMGSGGEQRRTMVLSNGEVIWDIAGNAREKVDADGLGGTISYTGPATTRNLESGDAEFISMVDTLTSSNGATFDLSIFSPATSGLSHATHFVGKYHVNGGVRTGLTITRGGNFSAGNNPGLFAGDVDGMDTSSSTSGGFRCAKSL